MHPRSYTPSTELDRKADLDDACALARDLDGDIALNLAPVLVRGLIEAHDNLADAASNFVGADLSAVDLVEIDLAGIR